MNQTENIFADIPDFGRLHFYRTYMFYDEPMLFACIDETLRFFFIEAIPTQIGRSWLAAQVSQMRLEKLEKNQFELRDVFTRPEYGEIWRIDNLDDQFHIRSVDPTTLTDDLLPVAGEYLDYTPNA